MNAGNCQETPTATRCGAGLTPGGIRSLSANYNTFGFVAQLAEQGTLNPKVVGSSPTGPTRASSGMDTTRLSGSRSCRFDPDEAHSTRAVSTMIVHRIPNSAVGGLSPSQPARGVYGVAVARQIVDLQVRVRLPLDTLTACGAVRSAPVSGTGGRGGGTRHADHRGLA